MPDVACLTLHNTAVPPADAADVADNCTEDPKQKFPNNGVFTKSESLELIACTGKIYAQFTQAKTKAAKQAFWDSAFDDFMSTFPHRTDKKSIKVKYIAFYIVIERA